MSKVTLNRVASLVNAPTTINGILTQIEQAFDNCLSRDGSAPNAMISSLDMNSNRILNLPAPSSALEPVRLTDLKSFVSNTPTEDQVTKRQFFSAVASLGNMNLLYQAIPADANNAIWIEFQAATTIQKTSALALLAKTTFSWSDAQLTACFTLAATLPF